MRYDVMIIGGGPGGYEAAHKAARKGLKTILFEKNKIGGTCLNQGCIPMKALIEAARTYKLSKDSDYLGVMAETKLDYAKVNSRRDEVVATLRGGVEKMLKADKVEIVEGQARIIAKDQISCNGEVYEGENIIVATGSIPALPPISGIEKAIGSDAVLEADFRLPSSLIIIGGGVIGSEIADALNRFGVRVTIIEMSDRLIPTMDRDLGQRLGMFFKKAGIAVELSARVEKIEADAEGKEVFFTDKKGESRSIRAEEVLIAAGRKANVTDLADPAVGLEIGKGIVADEHCRTNIANIYAIGDARQGNIQLAHVAKAQGENVIDLILNEEETYDLSVMPSGIYTEPEIAATGISEDQLKADGVNYVAKKALTGANGRCLIENSESGFVKILLVDDQIVGASIVAPHATELISELSVAVERKLSASELKKVVHPHPTVVEMIADALE